MRQLRRPVRRLAAALALAAAAPLAACGDSTAPLVTIDQVLYAPALGVDLTQGVRTASGMHYRDLAVGTGTLAETGKTVSVSYTGWLSDGTRFDGSTPQRPTFSFGIGAGEVRAIPGFEEGVVGMRVGGRRKLVIPPSLGYGQAGSGPVPGNTVIVFDVELVSVQ